MPLSDHEQKVLKEIENALYAEDPKFFMYVAKAKGNILTGISRRKTVVSMIFIVGVLLLIGGIFLPKVQGIPVCSLVGFVFILIGGFIMMNSPKKPQAHSSHNVVQLTLAKKMEQRFRKRFP